MMVPPRRKELRVGVKVITDSTSYIPRVRRETLDIGVAYLSSLLDGVVYVDDPDDSEAFYAALANTSSWPTTSQPTVQDLVDLMEERVLSGHSVVGVFISELMSGTYSAALLARDMVREKHPDAVIELIDGESNCMELGLAVLAAAEAAAGEASVAEVVAAAKERMLHTRFLFTPVTLDYLRRGGRIGNAEALLGTLLQIKPILTVADGVTDTFAKVRTSQKAQDLIVETFAADIRDKCGLGDAYIHHIHAADAGLRFAERITEAAGRTVEMLPIGPVIGTHVGPGTVGVVYYTGDRMGKSG